jgi:hypothetical protein
METLPFKEKVKQNFKIRTFSKDVNESELKWHTDDQDRVVIPLNETDWQLQMDNQLPIQLIKGKKYYIPEGEYHRVIKGNGDLNVKVIFK